MKVIEQYIINNRLIIKTDEEKYFTDGGRGCYSEIEETEFLKLINKNK